ncbi:hypothetical protein RB594_008525 [Gaeumannomyces avenae]
MMPVGFKLYPIRAPGAAAGLILQAIGLATAAYVGYKLCDFSALWLLPKIPLTRDYYHDGKGKGKGKGGKGPKAWALVTGASAGIGLGIAHELALLGFGVVLLGHKSEELSAAADAIRAEVGFVPSSSSSSSDSDSDDDSDSDSDDDNDNDPRDPVRTVVMDAAAATNAEMERALLGPVLGGALNVTVLVNNVGGQPAPLDPVFQRLDGYGADEADAILNLNARFMLRLTRMALPPLIAAVADGGGGGGNSGRRRALVLNVASAAGVIGIPGVAAYSASKAFVLCLTRTLAREMAAAAGGGGLAVDFVAVVPGDVSSQGNTAAAAGSPGAREFARAVVATAGRAARRGQRELVPWPAHAVQVGLLRSVVPAWVTERFMIGLMRDKEKAVYGPLG